MPDNLRRLLVVDDDPDIRTLIRLAVARWFDVTECDSGEAALVRATSGEHFDLIISDFMLPGISGLELVQRFRTTESTASVPLIMITAHTNYAMEDRAVSAGVKAFLYKPFTLSQLRAAVAKLGLHQPQAATT